MGTATAKRGRKEQGVGGRPKRARGATIDQALQAIAMLVEEPRRPRDLMEAFGCSRVTAHRLLATLNRIGLTLEVEHQRGGEVGSITYYRLPREVLKKKLGV